MDGRPGATLVLLAPLVEGLTPRPQAPGSGSFIVAGLKPHFLFACVDVNHKLELLQLLADVRSEQQARFRGNQDAGGLCGDGSCSRPRRPRWRRTRRLDFVSLLNLGHR